MKGFFLTTSNMGLKHFKKGCLLIAEPSLIGDNIFNRAIILLAENNANGALGFILNKPLDLTVQDFIPQIDSSFKIYNGGPVEQDNLYFIHTKPELIPDSQEISDGIYWGGQFELVINLINQKLIQKDDIRFFLGYTGWSKNQLEDEIKEKSWLITNNSNQKNILSIKSKNMWKQKITEIGGNYLIWSNLPEDPLLN